MKRLLLSGLIILLARTAFCQSAASDTNAYKYILDYQVPTSPAFSILDISPQQVTRAGAVKPLVANLFSNFLQTQKLDPGIAVDFSPFLLLGGGFKDLNEYKQSAEKRILANTLFSLATIKNQSDSSSTDIALGLRITLFDSHDLFSNSATLNEITNSIGTSLANRASAVVVPGGIPDDVIGPSQAVGLQEAYTAAYNKLKNIPGYAASAGFGYRATARNSVVEPDSLLNEQYKVWLSVSRYKFFQGADLLTILQGKFGKSIKPEWILGFALASQNKSNNMGAEAVYNFLTHEWDYSANFELKLIDKVSYVVSLGKRSSINGVETARYFTINSNLRLNLFSK